MQSDELVVTKTKSPTWAPSLPKRFELQDAAVLTASVLYVLVWWNRYLSPTVGFELFFITQYERGLLPYRDYFFVVQPGWVLGTLLISSLVGKHLIAFWFLGTVMRVWAIWCLHRWLLRVMTPLASALATITTLVVSSGDIDDFPGWYNYQTFIWAVLGGLCAAKMLESTSRSAYVWSALAGIALGLNFLTKQTSGILVALTILAGTMLIVWTLRGLARSGALSLTMLLGASLPVGATFLWLFQNGAWTSYIDQVYVRGPASKGGLRAALIRPVVVSIQSPELGAAFGLLCIAFLAFAIAWLYTARREPRARVAPLASQWYLLAGVGLAIATGVWATVRPTWDSRTFPLAAVYLGMIGTFVLFVAATAEWWRRGLSLPLAQKGMLAGISFAAAYAQSVSWAAWEPMALPALAVVLAYLFDLPRRFNHAAWLRAVTIVVCMVLIVVGTWRKTAAPATWGGWTEPPITQAHFGSGRPELAGFRLSEGTQEFYERVTAIIERNSKHDERILVFPFMPILYGLADRQPLTFAFQHWTDVCPEDVCDTDTDYLVEHPPAVMVIMELPDWAYAQQERDYRDGQPSAQRRLVAELDRMTREYELFSKLLAPGSKRPIKVWVRKARVSSD
jgi:hypothetical protein